MQCFMDVQWRAKLHPEERKYDFMERVLNDPEDRLT